jgi:catechol 2,3-dioxygenase-like lactoylglutathione lyase family enzyme
MASRLTEVVIDCHDLERMADFWCEALGYERSKAGDGWMAIQAPGSLVSDDALLAQAQPPALTFVVVPEVKTAKNRTHLDVTPFDRTRDDEVARLEFLGATQVDIGQGDSRWIVMADPEGNEFCVMPAVETAAG